MPPEADLLVELHPGQVHGTAAGRILSLAWQHWGVRYLRAGVLGDPAALRLAEGADTVFLGARFAEVDGFEEIVIAGVDTKKRHPDLVVPTGGLLSRPMDGAFVIRWGSSRKRGAATSGPEVELDSRAAMSAWARLDRSHLPGLEAGTVPAGSVVRCDVRLDPGLSISMTGEGSAATARVLSAHWNQKLAHLRTDLTARLIGLNLIVERATVGSTGAKATGWVALDRVESARFGDALETGIAELAESHGQSASSIIASRGEGVMGAGNPGRGVVSPARSGSGSGMDNDDCATAKWYLDAARSQLDNGKPILGIDKGGNMKMMEAAEAENFYSVTSGAVQYTCK